MDSAHLQPRRLLLYALLLVLAVAGWLTWRLIWGTPFSINHFADRAAIRFLLDSPETLTYLGMVDNTPLDFHSHRLSDFSLAAEQRRRQTRAELLQQLRQMDRDRTSGQDRVSYDFLHDTWTAERAAAAFPYHFARPSYQGPYPVNQLDGLQDAPLTLLATKQVLADARSAERYLQRLEAIPAYLEQVWDGVAYRESLGVIPPRPILQRLIEVLDQRVSQAPQDWGIYQVLAQGLDTAGLDQATQDRLLQRAVESLDSRVGPAYGRLLERLRAQLGQAPLDVGMWSLPDGRSYYQSLLAQHTTTTLGADEIHALGLAQVAAIEAEMDAILVAMGQEGSDFAARLAGFVSTPGIAYEAVDGVREQILQDYNTHVAELSAGVAESFTGIPDYPVEVRAVPPAIEAGSPAGYYDLPALDGSRPGVFYVNLAQPDAVQKFGMRTLAAHEAVPGHHTQTTVSMDLAGLPLARRFSYLAAFSEGWALYAERLVSELGLNDPLSELGRLQSEMFRAARLVVDTGLHAKRWTRQQAIDYMLAYTGQPESDIVNEVDRYIVMPGQACAYMVGMLELLLLREEARQRMGDRFELTTFHAAALENGDLPLTLLRREMEARLR